MKILFLGDASAVHYNLARGLRELGHEVVVVSDKIGWRGYSQDICLERNNTRLGAFAYLWKLAKLIPRIKGYDVVQFVGPDFLQLKAEKKLIIYKFLRQYNKHIVMDALGDDYYWAKICCDERPFRYGDFFIGEHDRRLTFQYAKKVYDDWTLPQHRKLNEYMAASCDKIVAVLYEYWKCYDYVWRDKTVFIPLPVIMPEQLRTDFSVGDKVKIFIGIQKERSQYKGTDIMLRAAQDIVRDYPDKCQLKVVENVPYNEYMQIMEGQDVILDQLYSYTPSMNALIAMARGIVCIGGGEPENYEIIKEKELRPIVNVLPAYDSVYDALKNLVMNKECLPMMKQQSVEYVMKHHDYRKVARQYDMLYKQL